MLTLIELIALYGIAASVPCVSNARQVPKDRGCRGPPLPLCDLPFPLLGGFWTSDNKIIIGIAGGQLRPFTADDSTDHTDAFPSLLPDGRHFVYSRFGPSPGIGGIY